MDLKHRVPYVGTAHRFEALDALRGVAVLMVVYDHLFAVAGEQMAGGAFAPVTWVRQWVSGPLGIIQDFGWFGVCLFFFISGFVIANSARNESVKVFALRRLFRIFPPLVVAVVVAAAIDLSSGALRPHTDYLWGATLAGYFVVPQVVVLGVAWTLVIEVLFYALMALVSPLLKRGQPAWGIALATPVPLLAILLAREMGDSFFLFASSMAYLPVLLIGSALYLGRACAVPLRWVVGLAVVNGAVFVLGLHRIHVEFLPIGNSYLVSALYALGVVAFSIGRSAPRALKFVGDVSYSLYLLHGLVGFVAVRFALQAGAGPFAPVIATVLVIALSRAMYRWVERPSISLGRRIAR